MTLAAAFLGDARERLLPASIPFRYFAAAAGFHVMAWLALVAGADDLPGFGGGPGPVLAALHLLALGVLVMTAMGASYQLLPVATRRPMPHAGLARTGFWLFAPATAVLSLGMLDANPAALHSGAGGLAVGLLIFAIVTAANLRRAPAMPVMAGHGWGALAALVGFAGLGLVLIADFSTGFLADRQPVVTAHMVLAAFGFMGLLAFGFSHILIPMFVLSRTLPVWPGRLELGLALLAVMLAVIGALRASNMVLAIAATTGLGASAAYLWLMRAAFATRMRKRLGLSFVLVRLSWGLLIAALLTGLAIAAGAPVPNGATLFGFLVLAGWLLTFLMGILQRIMPFLASMHAAGRGGRPALMSELTARTPLAIHAACHVCALVLCGAGIVLGAPLAVRLGALAGLAGSIAFALFAGLVMLRLRKS